MRKLVLVALVGALVLVPPAALGSSSAERPFRATLAGANEVPGPGATNGRGRVSVTIDPAAGEVCWRFRGLRSLGGKPTAAHIHKGRAGRAGGVVVPLGGAYRARGCADAAPRVLRAIVRRPGTYYVNVHNAAYPNGTVRGQLRAA